MTRDLKKRRSQRRDPSARELASLARTRDRRIALGLWVAALLLTTGIVGSVALQMRARSYAHLSMYWVIVDVGCVGLAIIMTMATRRGTK